MRIRYTLDITRTPKQAEYEPQPEGAYADTMIAGPSPIRDDSERELPDIRLGFQGH